MDDSFGLTHSSNTHQHCLESFVFLSPAMAVNPAYPHMGGTASGPLVKQALIICLMSCSTLSLSVNKPLSLSLYPFLTSLPPSLLLLLTSCTPVFEPVYCLPSNT